MLDQDDREAIIETVLKMIDERVVAPIEKLFDCMVFELIAQNAVDTARLAERLESLWQAMPAHEREGCGRIYNRYRMLLGNPGELADALTGSPPSTSRTDPARTGWVRGVIQGGASDAASTDKKDDPENDS